MPYAFVSKKTPMVDLMATATVPGHVLYNSESSTMDQVYHNLSDLNADGSNNQGCTRLPGRDLDNLQ